MFNADYVIVISESVLGWLTTIRKTEKILCQMDQSVENDYDRLDNETVCSVRKEDNSGYYRLHAVWKPAGFSLNVASENGAWRGEMTENQIKEMSSLLDMDSNAYLELCKAALATHNGLKETVYAVENGAFTWKKIIDEDSGMKLKMGSVMLQPASFVNTIQDIVDIALLCNQKLQKVISDLHHKVEKIAAARTEILNKLDDVVSAKDLMETELYNRFLVLLNAKKSKIAELEEENSARSSESRHRGRLREKSRTPYEMSTDEDDGADERDMIPTESEATFSTGDNNEKNCPIGGQNQTVGDEVEKDEEKTSRAANRDDGFREPSSSEGERKAFEKTGRSHVPSSQKDLLDFFYGPIGEE